MNAEQPRVDRFERRKQRTRKALKDATLDLVLEKGYDSVTIQDVVDRADLGRGTFYVHFKDKEAVVWDVITDELQSSFSEGEQRFPNEDFPPGYLGYLLTFENADRNRDLYRLMLGSQGSALLTQRVAQVLAQQIQASIEAGEYLEDIEQSPEILAQFIVGALIQMVLWWLEAPNDFTSRQMADMIYQRIHCKNVA